MSHLESTFPNTSLYGFSFQTNQFEVLRPNLPKTGILGTKIKKTIVKVRIITLEHHFESIFILNKALSCFGTNFARKSILGTKCRKIKSPNSLFWASVKQFTMFWVIVGHSVNLLGHCGSLWIIAAYSGS